MDEKKCSIDGCEKPLKARGWCGMHWLRWRRHGDPGDAAPTRLPVGDQCSVSGCARPPLARGWCGTHWSRWRNHGDPLIALDHLANLAQGRGPASPQWRGDSITYNGAHWRTRRARGRASDYACRCGEPAVDWAYDHADPQERVEETDWGLIPYSTDPAHYVPLCRPCHKEFDLAHINGQTVQELRAALDDLTEDELDDLIDAEIDRWTQPKESK